MSAPEPSVYCPKCLGDTFKILAKFDPESHEIAWYTLQGYCVECDAPAKFPTPSYTEV